jgi:acid-sensing ion channel, other
MNICPNLKLNDALRNYQFPGIATSHHMAMQSPSVEDIFRTCRFDDRSQLCEKIFNRIVTVDGLCFTFNMLNASEVFNVLPRFWLPRVDTKSSGWSYAGGYSESTTSEVYPYRIFGAGLDRGLAVELLTTIEDYEPNCRVSEGFKVILHTPVELPQGNKHFFRLSPNQELTIAIKPQVITASEDLESYSPDV